MKRRKYLATGASSIIATGFMSRFSSRVRSQIQFRNIKINDTFKSNLVTNNNLLVSFSNLTIEVSNIKNTDENITLKFYAIVDASQSKVTEFSVGLSDSNGVLNLGSLSVNLANNRQNLDISNASEVSCRIVAEHPDTSPNYIDIQVVRDANIIDGFESGSLDKWDDVSQSNTNPYIGGPSFEGSNALQIDADTGTSTRGELITKDSYAGSEYSMYVRKKRDGGNQNNLSVSLRDEANSESVSIVSSSYNNPEVELKSSGGNQKALGNESGTGYWFEVKFSFSGTELVAKWDDKSASMTTNHNFDENPLK